MPERLIGPVLKTGVLSAQPTPAEALAENTPADLGAFLGALAEVLANAPDSHALAELAALLVAWPGLPLPAQAGIAAMAKAATPTE